MLGLFLQAVLTHAARLVQKAAVKVDRDFPKGLPALPCVRIPEGLGRPQPPPPVAQHDH